MPISPELVGVFAGLTTSAFWVVTTVVFTAAGKRIGVTAVNALRMAFAIVLLGTTHLILFHHPVPQIPSIEQWIALALSGFIGLTICDQALFASFIDIGPRRALLFTTTTPIFSLTFGYAILGERVGPAGILGVLLTVGGILWVALERQGAEAEKPRNLRRGITLAVFGSLCQSLGALFAKIGMQSGAAEEAMRVDPLPATLVRMGFGLFGMTPIVLISYRMVKKRGQTGPRPRWTPGILLCFMGAVFGPFLGVWLSLVTFKHLELGIAQTLLTLSPVMILPFVGLLYKERLTRAAVLGAFVAIAGAAVISFSYRIDTAIGWNAPPVSQPQPATE